MRSSNSIFTKSRFGLDNNVWLTMVVVLLVSLSILSFKTFTHINCVDFDITAVGYQKSDNITFNIGEIITFSVPEQIHNRTEWDFGDGSKKVNAGKFVKHSFLREGRFTITCIVNNRCKQFLTVDITSTASKNNLDTTSFVIRGPIIIGMDTVYAGDNVHYITTIKANYNYQWSVPALPNMPTQTTAGAVFTFNKAGQQTLQLKIDENKIYTKVITVLSKKFVNSNSVPAPISLKIPPVITSMAPVSGGPGTTVTITGSFLGGTQSVSFGGIDAKFVVVSTTELTATVSEGSQSGPVVVVTENGPTTFANPPFTYLAPKPVQSQTQSQPQSQQSSTSEKEYLRITDKTLMRLLEQVKNNAMHVQDFDNFFCSGGKTIVYVNNDSKAISFSDLCQSLTANGKKIAIDTAIMKRDPVNPNCVASINIKYKISKKGILKRIGL